MTDVGEFSCMLKGRKETSISYCHCITLPSGLFCRTVLHTLLTPNVHCNAFLLLDTCVTVTYVPNCFFWQEICRLETFKLIILFTFPKITSCSFSARRNDQLGLIQLKRGQPCSHSNRTTGYYPLCSTKDQLS